MSTFVSITLSREMCNDGTAGLAEGCTSFIKDLIAGEEQIGA